MIVIYSVLSSLLYPFLILYIYLRKNFEKEDPHRYKEKIFISHYNIINKNNNRLIWFHAASIGEYKSIIPIIEKLKNNNANLQILITTTTLSSGNLASKEIKRFTHVNHRFLPLDVPFLIDKFLYLWRPDRIFLVDSEIWPNLILKAKKYNIPIAIINARLTAKSYYKWMRFPKAAKKIFGLFDLCLCSNEETKNYLSELNVKNVFYKGNIKLITKIDTNKIDNINENILLNKRFWFAASIHKNENIFCLQTHIDLKKKYKDLITIIAPRHLENTKEILNLSKKFNLTVQVLNENDKILVGKEVIIINFFGALQSYFKYANSVFMGKSMIEELKKEGGQNPIEAAKLNCKIYHGPYVYNFNEIYELLNHKNISQKIKNYKELSSCLSVDLENPIKRKNQNLDPINSLGEKTLNDTMKLVDVFLKNENN